jgi:hypothetical protein
MEHLANFSRQRIVEEVVTGGLQFSSAVKGRFHERLQELVFCRQRLRYLQEHFESAPEDVRDMSETSVGPETTSVHSPLPSAEAYWETIRESQTTRVVLPAGEPDLERAARNFLKTLTPEQWCQLDQLLQERVLGELGGLHKVCMTNSDLPRHFGNHLVAVAADCLGSHLPITDVAQVEFSGASGGAEGPAEHIRTYYERAVPVVAGQDEEHQHAFLLAPASDAGKLLAQEAKRLIPKIELVRVPGQADLMFCREQGYLSPEELQRVFRTCRQAYEDRATAPTTSPHARFDLVDWVPLDP